MGTLVDALGQSAGLKIKKFQGCPTGSAAATMSHSTTRVYPSCLRSRGSTVITTGRATIRTASTTPGWVELPTISSSSRSTSPGGPNAPTYLKLTDGRRQPAAGGDTARRGTSASLGIMPDYAYEKKDGLRITGVATAGRADKAGLKDGDRIVRCGSKEVGTIYDYMESMTQFKPGDQLEVVVVRDGKEVKLQVTLAGRPPE